MACVVCKFASPHHQAFSSRLYPTSPLLNDSPVSTLFSSAASQIPRLPMSLVEKKKNDCTCAHANAASIVSQPTAGMCS